MCASESGMHSPRLTNCAGRGAARLASFIFLSTGILLVSTGLADAATFSYHVLGDEPGSWPRVMESIGLHAAALGPAGVVIAPRGTNLPGTEWADRVDQ